jgi:hypothetical protein
VIKQIWISSIFNRSAASRSGAAPGSAGRPRLPGLLPIAQTRDACCNNCASRHTSQAILASNRSNARGPAATKTRSARGRTLGGLSIAQPREALPQQLFDHLLWLVEDCLSIARSRQGPLQHLDRHTTSHSPFNCLGATGSGVTTFIRCKSTRISFSFQSLARERLWSNLKPRRQRSSKYRTFNRLLAKSSPTTTEKNRGAGARHSHVLSIAQSRKALLLRPMQTQWVPAG